MEEKETERPYPEKEKEIERECLRDTEKYILEEKEIERHIFFKRERQRERKKIY